MLGCQRLGNRIAGVKLVHKTGYTRCGESETNNSYFGCGSETMTVQLVRIMDEKSLHSKTYYPLIDIDGRNASDTLHAHA